MLKKLFLTALFLTFPLQGMAQGTTTITALPAVTLPLSGTEVAPLVQGGVTKKASVAQILTGLTGSQVAASLGYTPLRPSLNLSDVSNAASARTNLGLAIGTNVQAYSANLTGFAALTPPAGNVVGTTDTQTLFNKSLSGASNTFTNIGNAALTNSSITLGSTPVSLGATASSVAGLSLTTPTINTAASVGGTWTAAATWTLPAFTLGGTVTATGQTLTGGAYTNATFTGNTWNNGVIGGTTPAAITGTLITATNGVIVSGTGNVMAVGGVGGFASADTIAQFRPAANKNFAVRGNMTLGSGVALQAVNDANMTQSLELYASGATLGLNGGTVVFPSIGTTASAANAFLDSGASNSLLRSTSSVRYKRDVQDVSQLAYARLLALRPITYRSKAPADDPAKEWYGLIAEEVAEVDPMLVQWSYPLVEDPKTKVTRPNTEAEKVPDGVQYERLTVLLLGVVKSLDARLKALEAN